MDKVNVDLLAEFARGGELIFDNAEQLYREARILCENGAYSRALPLHQLSNEECGKLEILGGYAMTVILGEDIKPAQMAKTFRDHEEKNYANAYFARITDEERSARERGDWIGASIAFKELQAKLHNIFNTNKNTGFYVNFEDGKFSTPKEVITVELVNKIATLNEYFLGITFPYVRLLQRLASNEF